MTTQVTGGGSSLSLESSEEERELLLENLLELKVITLHLAEIADVKYDQEDVDLETN